MDEFSGLVSSLFSTLESIRQFLDGDVSVDAPVKGYTDTMENNSVETFVDSFGFWKRKVLKYKQDK